MRPRPATRLIQEIGFGGLQTIYAPEAWSIPAADGIPLTLLLNDQKDIQLQRVTLAKKTKIIAASVAALLVLAIAFLWYQQEKANEERLLNQRAFT